MNYTHVAYIHTPTQTECTHTYTLIYHDNVFKINLRNDLNLSNYHARGGNSKYSILLPPLYIYVALP